MSGGLFGYALGGAIGVNRNKRSAFEPFSNNDNSAVGAEAMKRRFEAEMNRRMKRLKKDLKEVIDK